MHSVSAAFESAIAEGMVRMCELYEVELPNGNIYRYTNHDKDIIWDAAGNTYTSIPLHREPARFNTDGQCDECEAVLGIRDLSFLNLVKRNILEAAKITQKLIRWDASYAADEQIILNTWVPDPSFNRKSLSLRLIGYLDSLNIKVPAHNYQDACNHFLFDDTCGLTKSDYAYSGTATAGSRTTLTDSGAGTLYKVNFDNGDSSNPIARGEIITGGDNGYTAKVVQIVYLTANTGSLWYVELSNDNNFNDNEMLNSGGNSVTINGTPVEDTEFYQQGELEMTGGDNSGEQRPILSSSGSVRTVLWPFPYEIDSGDTYKIYPGCDFTAFICYARFNNKTKWRGFAFLPGSEEIFY